MNLIRALRGLPLDLRLAYMLELANGDLCFDSTWDSDRELEVSMWGETIWIPEDEIRALKDFLSEILDGES